MTSELFQKISRAFVRLGRFGFWVQLGFLIAVALLGIYAFGVVGGRAGAGNILAFLGLALPVFTTYWCWRYARLGRGLAESDESEARPRSLLRSAWIGVWAGALGTGVTLVSLFGAVSGMLVVMLANPQIGIQVSPANASASAYTISAVDAVSLMALLLTLTAELVVVAISLRLVFLVSGRSGQSDL